MESENKSKLEYWTNHITGAEAHPAGMAAYFAEHNIRPATYYGWRKYIKNEGATFKKKASKKSKLTKSPFIPVAVNIAPARLDRQPLPRLPEAQWVASVMMHLIRGLS